jgi:autotransporter-associated beta strand protein
MKIHPSPTQLAFGPFFVLLASVSPILGATKTWNTTSGTLSASGSWSPTGTPTATDETLFDGTVTPAATINSAAGTNLTFGNFIWDNNSSSIIQINSISTTNTQLRLSGGGGFTAATAAGGATGDLIVMGTNALNNTLTISEVNPSGGVSLRLRLDNSGNFNVVNSGATLHIDTIISESGGNRTLTKTGAGTLRLSASNTYSGGTVLTAGRILVGSSGAFGAGNVAINGGTIAAVTSSRTLANAILVGGDFSLGGGGAAIVFEGTFDLGGASRQITLLGNTVTVAGVVSNGGLVLANEGASFRTFNLNNSNTFGGGVTINGGILNANNADALGAGSVTVSGGVLAPFGIGAGAVNLGAGAGFSMSSGSVRFNLGTVSDQIVGNSASFNISGGTLELTLGEGFSYSSTYTLFSSFVGGSVFGLSITGFETDNYTASLSDAGVLSFSAVVIPEPASFAILAGLGSLGLAAHRRRRR